MEQQHVKWTLNTLVQDTMEEYLSAPFEQSSTIKYAVKSLRDYHWFKKSERKESASQRFGTLLHTSLLTPDEMENKYVVFNPNDRPNPDQTFGAKANKEWKDRIYAEAEAAGKIIVEQDDYERYCTVIEQFEASKFASLLESSDFEQKKTEVSIYTDLMGLACKARFDHLAFRYDQDGTIVEVQITELKCVDSSHPDDFIGDIFKYGWDIQAFMQVSALSSILPSGVTVNFRWLAIGTTPPFGIQDYTLESSAFQDAKERFIAAKIQIQDYKNKVIEVPCGYYAESINVDIPAWKKKKKEQLNIF